MDELLNRGVKIIIGKRSNNDLFIVELQNLPHLFVSYSEDFQFQQLFSGIIENNKENDRITLITAFKKSTKLFCKISIDESSNNIEAEKQESKYDFWKSLMREFKKRKVGYQKSKNIFLNKQNILVVLIDDLIGTAITQRKYTGLYFLQLLVEGPALKIHFVACSGTAYKNLLNQMLSLNPKIKKALQAQMPDINFSVHYPLGAELIITPDDFYFFKERGSEEFERMYKV